MDNAEISTPETVVEEDTSTEVAPDEDNAAVEPESTEESAETESEKEETEVEQKKEETTLLAGKFKDVETLEKSYKELEPYVTKVAELEKKLEEITPKEPGIIDERGHITPEFEQRYKFEVDNAEFITYEQACRNIPDIEQRQEIENLLDIARNSYGYNPQIYKDVMSKIKENFGVDFVEKVTAGKLQMASKMSAKFEYEAQKNRMERAFKAEQALKEHCPEIYELCNQQSSKYSKDFADIIGQIFVSYGSLDTELINNAVSVISKNAIESYIAEQKATQIMKEQKEKASVPTGGATNSIDSYKCPTASQIASMSQDDYDKAVEKWGLEKLLKAK